MASVIHIAEVAAILAVAYSLGWVVGYFARRLTLRTSAATVPPERIEAVIAGAGPDALVKAPVIAPVAGAIPATAPVDEEPSAPATSSPPAPEPALVVTEAGPTDLAEPVAAAVIEPVPHPVEMPDEPSTSPAGAPEPALRVAPVDVPAIAPQPEQPKPKIAASFRRFRPTPKLAEEIVSPPPSPPGPPNASPASRPGEAWTGEIRGKSPMAPPPVPAAPEPLPATTLSAVAEAGVAPSRAPVDEEDAMRAIEGSWSRVGARALPDAPEISDLGAAVAAAQTAVEQVLATVGIDPAAAEQGMRPKGLPRARAGRKDDLRQIEGLSELDEGTLNNLGIFHFDQISAWTEPQVLWLENHAFARGRIGREEWQRQARNLLTSPMDL